MAPIEGQATALEKDVIDWLVGLSEEKLRFLAIIHGVNYDEVKRGG